MPAAPLPRIPGIACMAQSRRSGLRCCLDRWMTMCWWPASAANWGGRSHILMPSPSRRRAARSRCPGRFAPTKCRQPFVLPVAYPVHAASTAHWRRTNTANTFLHSRAAGARRQRVAGGGIPRRQALRPCWASWRCLAPRRRAAPSHPDVPRDRSFHRSDGITHEGERLYAWQEA